MFKPQQKKKVKEIARAQIQQMSTHESPDDQKILSNIASCFWLNLKRILNTYLIGALSMLVFRAFFALI